MLRPSSLFHLSVFTQKKSGKKHTCWHHVRSPWMGPYDFLNFESLGSATGVSSTLLVPLANSPFAMRKRVVCHLFRAAATILRASRFGATQASLQDWFYWYLHFMDLIFHNQLAEPQ